MKHIKNALYTLGVLAVLGIVLCVSTAIAQLGTEAMAKGIGFSLKNDWLYSISGSMGTAITGALCAFYAKRKKYTDCIEAKEPFRVKTGLYYGLISFCICSVLFYAISTFLFVNVFSLTGEVFVPAQKSWIDIVLKDVIFTIIMAPIFEELLFRMGLYSLLRRRMGKIGSILIVTLVFAAIHGYSIEGFFACLTGGLLFMLIYVRTGNIWYSIVAHMVCNLDTTIFNALEAKSVAFWGFPVQYEINGFNMVHPVLIVTAAVILGICITKEVKATRKAKCVS